MKARAPARESRSGSARLQGQYVVIDGGPERVPLKTVRAIEIEPGQRGTPPFVVVAHLGRRRARPEPTCQASAGRDRAICKIVAQIMKALATISLFETCCCPRY